MHANYVDPLPPPLNVQLIRATPEELTFNWSSVEPSCSTLQYRIESNCGICTTNSQLTASATCSIEMSTITDNVCKFSVKSVVCNDITGSMSVPVNVSLKGEPGLACRDNGINTCRAMHA